MENSNNNSGKAPEAKQETKPEVKTEVKTEAPKAPVVDSKPETSEDLAKTLENQDDTAPAVTSGTKSKAEQEELDLLKDRARMMGLAFSPNIGLDTLRERVNAQIKGEEIEKEEFKENLKKEETFLEMRKRLQKEQMKLVRVRISCMNPAKRDLNGEFFSVSNKFLGVVKKFIPFGEATDNGYHIPLILFNNLKARKFQQIKIKKVNGQDTHETRMVPEFAFEVLPDLTKEEIKELKDQQEAAKRLSGE